jgi:chromosome segregation ATPase
VNSAQRKKDRTHRHLLELGRHAQAELGAAHAAAGQAERRAELAIAAAEAKAVALRTQLAADQGCLRISELDAAAAQKSLRQAHAKNAQLEDQLAERNLENARLREQLRDITVALGERNFDLGQARDRLALLEAGDRSAPKLRRRLQARAAELAAVQDENRQLKGQLAELRPKKPIVIVERRTP